MNPSAAAQAVSALWPFFAFFMVFTATLAGTGAYLWGYWRGFVAGGRAERGLK